LWLWLLCCCCWWWWWCRFALRLWRSDPRLRVSDPLGDVTSFIATFREQFPGDQGRYPAFYQGSYSQAVSDAKRELRFLLVYLHVEQHPDTNTFCRETLCHPEVVDLLNSRTVVWACSTSRPEGYRVSQALRSPACPFVGVLCLREQRVSVVGRLEGALPPTSLRAQLELVLERNQHHLDREHLQREERSETQALRLQQDEAYLVSLRADQEKERLRRERRDAQERETRRRDADLQRQSLHRQ
ncbi:FAS-associated factor 2, partial [Lampetra planeri]